jgi:acetyl/propionyl-CoA carboxylase alpha subunit
VREQISIAADNKISFKQEDISINGYALECRIYAEDPENNFLPSTGKILHYKEPNGIGVRVDSGFSSDSEISIYYDPMIAKLICWDLDRIKAISRMNRALIEFQITGITINTKFLSYIINTEEFAVGGYDINFIDNLDYSGTSMEDNQKSNDEHEIAASVLAALINTKKKSIQKKSVEIKNNKWWEQIHD